MFLISLRIDFLKFLISLDLSFPLRYITWIPKKNSIKTVRLIVGFVLLKLLIHLYANTFGGYEIYRDELYLYACSTNFLRFKAKNIPPSINKSPINPYNVHWYPSKYVDIPNAITGITKEIYPALSGPIFPSKFR